MENSTVMQNGVCPTTKHSRKYNDHETNRKAKENKLQSEDSQPRE